MSRFRYLSTLCFWVDFFKIYSPSIIIHDESVKSLVFRFFVISAEERILLYHILIDPRFRGSDRIWTFYRFVTNDCQAFADFFNNLLS